MIAALESQMPAHSVPPSMIQTLEDLEDELVVLLDELNRDGETNA